MRTVIKYLGVTFILCLALVSTCSANQVNDQIKNAADVITEDMLLAMNENNYEKFAAKFDQKMKEGFTTEKFQTVMPEIKAKIGDYVSKTYILTETNAQYTVITYKAKFSQEESDVLVRTVLSQIGAEFYVAGFWLDSPNLRN